MSNGPSFEAFPTEIRLKIYRLILLSEEYLDPHHVFFLPHMHPAILSTNKKIHAEGASVLYWENCFQYTVDGLKGPRLWHFEKAMGRKPRLRVPGKYTKLITKLCLEVVPHMWAIEDSLAPLTKSLDIVAKKLITNNLRLLKINFRGCLLVEEQRGMSHNPKCLESLLKIRAARVRCLLRDSPYRKRANNDTSARN